MEIYGDILVRCANMSIKSKFIKNMTEYEYCIMDSPVYRASNTIHFNNNCIVVKQYYNTTYLSKLADRQLIHIRYRVPED
jgi:hypothetical protein